MKNRLTKLAGALALLAAPGKFCAAPAPRNDGSEMPFIRGTLSGYLMDTEAFPVPIPGR
jgi:hypothetical protein